MIYSSKYKETLKNEVKLQEQKLELMKQQECLLKELIKNKEQIKEIDRKILSET